jgi:hypothetical protein
MKLAEDVAALQQLAPGQRGVFSVADLRAVLGEPHRAAVFRRVEALVERGELTRVVRGIYVAREFDLGTLSQRLAPDSAISFETVLADALVIGPRPVRGLRAIRCGRGARYVVGEAWIEHHRVAPHLRFGEVDRKGIRMTVPEKAILDVLAFHQRGRPASFDIRSDVALDRLDRRVLRDFLGRYENPRFVAFARDVLGLS